MNLSGGDKFEAALTRIAKKLGKKRTLRVGFLEGATYPDKKGTLVAAVAAFNEFGTSKSPPRPFFRGMIAAKSPEWPEAVSKQLKKNDYDVDKTLNIVGEAIGGQLKQSIQEFSGVPLSPKTIKRKKGVTKQLIDTGVMINSVDHEVVD